MNERMTRLLVTGSVRAYPLILHVYPPAFRREYGDAMTQLFQDETLAAWRSSGLTGLATLWMHTIWDVMLSVPDEYLHERNKAMFKAALGIGILYACTLAVTVGYGALRFGEFYERPAFSNFESAQPANEDVVIAAYAQALGGEFGRYRMFAGAGAIAATALLGLGAGLFGLSQKSILHGALAFGGGAIITVLALSALPYIWFPLDRYPVAALWVFSGLPVVALLLAAGVMTAGRLVDRRRLRSA